jgi:hypothetical protein
MATATVTQEFESVTCSRCHGTGTHSYCQMYGDTCFKCSGKRRVYTARGLAALQFYIAQLSKPVREIKVGDVVKLPHVSKFQTVADIFQNSPERKGSAWSLDKAGNPVFGQWEITLANGTGRCGMTGEEMVRVAATAERKAQVKAAALAFQSTLTKDGTPRKR